MDPSDGNGCALYAELLVNIRQISLAASLPSITSDGPSPRVSIASDCRTVELTHGAGTGSSTTRLTLPAKAAIGATALPIPDRQKSTATLSWRLPLEPSSLPPSHQADDMPWSATDLETGCGVACRQCGSNIIPAGAVATWKDLPSENWAEMMEFWHCHKPDHHHHHSTDEDHSSGKADEKSLASRGYGASSAISAQEGIGFVDLTTLLFAETDCQNVTVSAGGTIKPRPTRATSIMHALCFVLFVFLLRHRRTEMGIKKVAKPADSASVAWIPIQMPQINILARFPAHAGHCLVMTLPQGRDISFSGQPVLHSSPDHSQVENAQGLREGHSSLCAPVSQSLIVVPSSHRPRMSKAHPTGEPCPCPIPQPHKTAT